MTMARPREHALSKKLRKADQSGVAKVRFQMLAAQLDQTIHALGIWKDPERIKTTSAYRQAERALNEYERLQPRGT